MGRALTKYQSLTELVELLRERPMTTREMSERTGVSQRGIQRYLNELDAQGYELGKSSKRYSLPRTDRSRELNPVEALAVHTATRMLLHHTRSNEAHFRSALRKLAQNLPDPARSQLERSVQWHQSRSLEPSRRTLEKVAEAWFEGSVLRFRYQAPIGSGKAHSYEFETYLVEVNPTNLLLYAIGFERSYFRSQITLRLDRMSDVEVTSSTYSVPDDFDATAFLDKTWGVVAGERVEVLVRLSREAVPHLEDSFVRSATVVERAATGDLTLKLTAGTDKHGLPIDLIPWLLSWGEHAEVLEPASLRAHLAARLTKAAETYNH